MLQEQNQEFFEENFLNQLQFISPRQVVPVVLWNTTVVRLAVRTIATAEGSIPARLVRDSQVVVSAPPREQSLRRTVGEKGKKKAIASADAGAKPEDGNGSIGQDEEMNFSKGQSSGLSTRLDAAPLFSKESNGTIYLRCTVHSTRLLAHGFSSSHLRHMRLCGFANPSTFAQSPHGEAVVVCSPFSESKREAVIALYPAHDIETGIIALSPSILTLIEAVPHTAVKYLTYSCS